MKRIRAIDAQAAPDLDPATHDEEERLPVQRGSGRGTRTAGPSALSCGHGPDGTARARRPLPAPVAR